MRVLILSDLHIGATTGSATSDAWVSFLDWVVERSDDDAAPWRLVVLGDFLDLLHAPADVRDPLAALDAVAARHRSTFAALGAAVERGVQIDVVPGNHDSELLDTDVQEHLRALVAEAAAASPTALLAGFRIRRWFLLVPGYLYAEHGSQYHALHAVADPLAPSGRWSPQLPPGAALDLLLGDWERGRRTHALRRLLSALARRGSAAASTGASLEAHASESGISLRAVGDIHALGENSWAALVRNAHAAALGRSSFVESRQQRAALAVHRILTGERQSVPAYVFGHTHRAAHCALDADGTRLLCFNSGAWTNGGYEFVELSRRAGGVTARLCRWDPLLRSAIALSGPLSSATFPAQVPELTRRRRNAGSGSAVPVARS